MGLQKLSRAQKGRRIFKGQGKHNGSSQELVQYLVGLGQ